MMCLPKTPACLGRGMGLGLKMQDEKACHHSTQDPERDGELLASLPFPAAVCFRDRKGKDPAFMSTWVKREGNMLSRGSHKRRKTVHRGT